MGVPVSSTEHDARLAALTATPGWQIMRPNERILRHANGSPAAFVYASRGRWHWDAFPALVGLEGWQSGTADTEEAAKAAAWAVLYPGAPETAALTADERDEEALSSILGHVRTEALPDALEALSGYRSVNPEWDGLTEDEAAFADECETVFRGRKTG